MRSFGNPGQGPCAGWLADARPLKEELLEQTDGVMGAHRGGGEEQGTDAQRPERLLRKELRRRGWTEAELGKRRKTEAGKVKFAERFVGADGEDAGLDCRTAARAVPKSAGQWPAWIPSFPMPGVAAFHLFGLPARSP